MAIGEFSERSGLSRRRLRSYAAAGLLVPVAVDSGSGYRYYAADQLGRARAIDALRRAGIPLADVAEVLRDPSSGLLGRWSDRVAAEAKTRQEALLLARRLLGVDTETDRTGDREGREGKEPMMHLQPYGRSETGPVREGNQDAWVGTGRLVAVADGMGASPGGDTAASLALAIVDAAFAGGSSQELAAAARAANRAVFERASSSKRLEGMGTTLCAAGLTEDGHLAFANVGDSRAYLVKGGIATCVTDDHSVTAEMVRRGELTEVEAVGHPHRRVLTRAVGIGPAADVDVFVEPADVGDRVVLCTDGLFNEVPIEAMVSAMERAGEAPGIADDLVGQAVAHGGHDNVTVVVAEVCT